MGKKTRTGRQRGQALVEMALIIVVFLFLFIGIIEFGRAMYTYSAIVQATRAGARSAVVNVRNESDTANRDRAANVVVYGDPDVSSGTPVLAGLPQARTEVHVVAIETSNGLPISQKVTVRVENFQFHFVLPIEYTITIPAFETSL